MASRHTVWGLMVRDIGCGRRLLRSWPGSKQQEGSGILKVP